MQEAKCAQASAASTDAAGTAAGLCACVGVACCIAVVRAWQVLLTGTECCLSLVDAAAVIRHCAAALQRRLQCMLLLGSVFKACVSSSRVMFTLLGMSPLAGMLSCCCLACTLC